MTEGSGSGNGTAGWPSGDALGSGTGPADTLRIGMLMPVAAPLEAGGNAPGRGGPRGEAFATTGAAVLPGCGVPVNGMPAGFGRAPGVSAAVFLVVTEGIGIPAVRERPKPGLLSGGALAAAGGAVMAGAAPGRPRRGEPDPDLEFTAGRLYAGSERIRSERGRRE